MLFKHFKDNTFISQSFLLLFMIRNLLFNLSLAPFFEHPLIQAILILIMSLLIFLYLLIQRPFKPIINLLQHITCEIVFLVVNICILILAQINFEKENSYQFRDNLCEVIIYTSLIFSFFPQVFLALKLVSAVFEWYKASYCKSIRAQRNLTRGSALTTRPREPRCF